MRPIQPKKFLKDLSTIIVVVILTFAARSSIADHFHIPTGSMEPTVHGGDRILVLKTAYDLRVPFADTVIAELSQPSRGDIVVLDSPEQDLLLLKRIVALPGDRVAVDGGRVWIDGELAELDYEINTDEGGGPDIPETLVPPQSYLVLGDNRGDSRDGRVFGMIQRSRIRGQALRVYRSKGAFAWRGL